MMTAVMQPYLFPYIGYFQLVAAVDRFVFYDDVQYINDGWINRNRLPHGWFTVPVVADRLAALINEREVASGPYARFRRKWLKGFELRYRRAPYYPAVRELVEQTFVAEPTTIDAMARRSVRDTAAYLGLTVDFSRASQLHYDRTLAAQDRLLGLLESCSVGRYLNLSGGRGLYDGPTFTRHGIELNFLTSTLDYTGEQPGFGFSILHLLAHHPPATCREWLDHCTITSPPAHASTQLDAP